MPQLLISQADRFLKALVFRHVDVLTIGRAPANDIVLADPRRKVSRYHAALVRAHPAEERYFVRDLGSLTATRVGAAAVHQRVLNHGDVVQVGDYELAYSTGGEAEGAEPVLEEAPVPAGGRAVLEVALRKARTGLRLSKILEALIEPVLHATRSVTGFAGLFLPDRKLAYRMVGLRGADPRMGDGLRIRDAAVLERLRAGCPVHDRNLLLVPIPARGGVAGFLCAWRGYASPAFTPGDRELLAMLATLAAAHVQKRSPEAARASPEILEWPLMMVGKAEAIQQAIRQIRTAALADAAVLLTGEPGAGKSIAARAIHQASRRCAGPFVAVHLSESPAAFSRHELPQRGTLLLSEIACLDRGGQARLLEAIEAGADVRVLATTTRDLEAAVAQGAFAPELYRRIAAFRIDLSPLRQRQEDIPLLAFYFLDRYARAYGSQTRSMSHRALALLSKYAWPGNVAELEGYIAAAVSGGREVLFSWDLPPCVQAADPAGVPATSEQVQKLHLMEVLESTAGNISRTAEMLDWSRQTVVNKMNRFGIPRPSAEAGPKVG